MSVGKLQISAPHTFLTDDAPSVKPDIELRPILFLVELIGLFDANLFV